MSSKPDAAAIRKLNDEFRQSIGRPAQMAGKGRLAITAGIQMLKPNELSALFLAIQTFSNFSAENDAHGEHDFGKVTVFQHKCFWKIDYYSQRSMNEGSEDPADPTKTLRVMTVMLAEEY